MTIGRFARLTGLSAGTLRHYDEVEDLDAYHARAIEAGATEITPPHESEGVPRNSAIRDPSGNWISLAQASHAG